MPSRYLCSALEEMRDHLKYLDVHNLDRYKSITAMMIEEIQTLGNRMEAALRDWRDYEGMLEKKRKLKKEIRELQAEKNALSDGEKDQGEYVDGIGFCRVTNLEGE